VFDRFGIPSQPAMAFVRADGTFDKVTGAVDDDELAERVADLLASA